MKSHRFRTTFPLHRYDPVLKPGMTLAIEPMVNVGSYQVKVDPRPLDGDDNGRVLLGPFEHTVLVTAGIRRFNQSRRAGGDGAWCNGKEAERNPFRTKRSQLAGGMPEVLFSLSAC